MKDSHNTQSNAEQIAAFFLEFSCSKLEQMTQTIAACVTQLSDAQVWQRGGAHENSIANLVLHLCGNMRQWILHGVGGAPDVRTRDLEFSTERGQTAADLLAMFKSTIAEATAVIRAVTPERLLERTRPQGRDATVLDAIYQVVGHVQQHAGQIILLTKQMTGRDLDLTIPRPR